MADWRLYWYCTKHGLSFRTNAAAIQHKLKHAFGGCKIETRMHGSR